jgi:hypothetical protein
MRRLRVMGFMVSGATVVACWSDHAPPEAAHIGDSLVDSPRPAPAGVPLSIDIRPANGTVFRQNPIGLPVEFAGFFVVPTATIEVQVLADANGALAESNWITIARARTADQPTRFNDATPIFRWSTIAVPVPTIFQAARWRPGGLLRYRTIAVDSSGKRASLPFFDAGSGDCIKEVSAKSWKDVLAKCASPFAPEIAAPVDTTTHAATLVSAAASPASERPPPYLNRKGQVRPEDTDAYYQAVDAPTTLDRFRERFAFTSDVQAVYYNRGDLGIGRDMHCKTFRLGNEDGTACYVSNYGVNANGSPAFGGDPDAALADAVERRNSFATVAMVKFGARVAPPEGNDVQFFVYDAKGELANEAALDTTGQNPSIPNNCINCHGGQYDRAARRLVGATFLPFDPDAFLFSRRPGFTYDAQADQIRELNRLVRDAGGSPAIVQFVNGIYGNGADRAGARANLDWIPPGWSQSREAKAVYREAIKPYCRTCHVAQNGEFSFMRAEDLKLQGRKTLESICQTTEMPIAEATLSLFWNSPARAHLVNALDASNACAPLPR